MSITNRYLTSLRSIRCVGLVDLLHPDHLDVAHHTVAPAEVEHLLRLGDASDERAGKIPARHEQTEHVDGLRVERHADEYQRRVEVEQREVGVEVVVGGDRVEDHVEAAGVAGHGVGVLRDDHFVGAQPPPVCDLAFRCGEKYGVRTHRVRELHAHVVCPPSPTNPTFRPLPALHLRRGE